MKKNQGFRLIFFAPFLKNDIWVYILKMFEPGFFIWFVHAIMGHIYVTEKCQNLDKKIKGSTQ